MTATPFGHFDSLLIKTSINQKLWVISIGPILALLFFTATLLNEQTEIIEHHTQQQLTATVNQLSETLTPLIDSLSPAQIMQLNNSIKSGGISKNDNGSGHGEITVKGNQYHATAALGSHHYVYAYAARIAPYQVVKQHTELMLLLAVTVLFSAWFGYLVVSYFRNSVERLTQVMALGSANDLTVRINFPPGRDEFSPLANHIDELIATRQRVVTNLLAVSGELQRAATTLQGDAGNSNELSVKQRQHIDNLATAMEQMNATVAEVASHAEQTSQETQQATVDATRGQQQISDTIGSIEKLVADVHNASDAVVQVNTNAAGIDDVVTTINAISEQTNLLALNAAIEAARAGEQGRGFAVVADEVRSLAGRTQQATVEIQQMIEELQQGMNSLEQIMRNTVNLAESGRKMVSQAGNDLTQITNHSQTVFSMSAQIATAAEEQSAVAQEIVGNLLLIRNESHELEVASTSSKQASEQVGATANSLSDSLSKLRV
ncbi:methyl-accepting chemotaxis protein [Ferrimonas lipolytica]|uniref:Methyl-accepting chemotaxis protein n=1 Tax=Ferrimonas lipolytica TaxID=2724191 RepID=A0A6H1UCH3_9GAMM|nr:methyl-accepting chemotaxis protein [Ferrimonas lipolytica]QIZ76761.1 methyl-accepting chemotaxis protein [Ferrimonas lipolytica]